MPNPPFHTSSVESPHITHVSQHIDSYKEPTHVATTSGLSSCSPIVPNKSFAQGGTHDSPISIPFPSDSLDTSMSDNGASSALSNKLLHEAFASLSLTDKCALSLSMSQLTSNDNGMQSSRSTHHNTPRGVSIGETSHHHMTTHNVGNSLSNSNHTDEINDIQSVLSESDIESLDVAMSMMGHSELKQVEDEVTATIFNKHKFFNSYIY